MTCIITVTLRLVIDYVIVIGIFFDKKFSRLYNNFIIKEIVIISLSIILDLFLFLNNIFLIQKDESD